LLKPYRLSQSNMPPDVTASQYDMAPRKKAFLERSAP
jgi:hypothetical protein